MPVTKDMFLAALRHGGPIDGPYDITPDERKAAIDEFNGVKVTKPKKAKRARSAVTGEFVTLDEAAANPAETVVEEA